jgi:hypothetical protein
MEVDTRAWAYFDYRITQVATNQTHFATRQPGVGDIFVVATNYPQFPLIVNVPFNLTFNIVSDTNVQVSQVIIVHKCQIKIDSN